MNDFIKLTSEIKKAGNKQRAQVAQRFFKTGPDQYGAGDVFLGLTMPQQRQIAKKYPNLGLAQLKKLLASPYHEWRMISLLILINQYKKAQNLEEKGKLVDFYLKNSKYINNWDLVDVSVHLILGDFLLNQPDAKKILDRLAASANLWERRMAMIATLAFIRQQRAQETLLIAKKLLNDQHDLIHKAVGWMLREMGKQIDRSILLKFLDQHGSHMPRTALRYAIEHLPDKQRLFYLSK